MIWLGLAVVIVAVAAALLIWILVEARRIRQNAERALHAVETIRRRTEALRAIPAVTHALGGAVATTGAIAAHATALRDALEPGEADR